MPCTHSTTEIRTTVATPARPAPEPATGAPPTVAQAYLDSKRAIEAFWKDLDDLNGYNQGFGNGGCYTPSEEDSADVRAAILDRTFNHLGFNVAAATALLDMLPRYRAEEERIGRWFREETRKFDFNDKETRSKPEYAEAEARCTAMKAEARGMFKPLFDPQNRIHRNFLERIEEWMQRLPE